MDDKPWKYEDDPEKAIILALQKIADVWSVEDDLLRDARTIRIKFKRDYNPTRQYVSGSVE